ncbi:MAG: peptide chain release factor N(5)-glutamine methyltransferase [Bacteroidota bacterium]
MNLKEILSAFNQQLKDIYDQQEILFIFYVTAEEVTGLQRSRLLILQDISVDDNQIQEFFNIADKLKLGIPLQYVLGSCLFYGIKLNVNPSVLIPRPETEELVQWILEDEKSQPAESTKSILDIGTGSGCIAIALKLNRPQYTVSALDVSEKALEIATRNAKENKADISFIFADIRNYNTLEKFDIIVSNPPYITFSEKVDMHENVLDNEPHLALFVKNEYPLEFYESIAKFAIQALNPEGLLYFEINESFGDEMVSMLRTLSFKKVRLRKDMQGKDRMISCKL